MNRQACGSNALRHKIVFSQKRIEYNHYISRQENLKGFYYNEKNNSEEIYGSTHESSLYNNSDK